MRHRAATRAEPWLDGSWEPTPSEVAVWANLSPQPFWTQWARERVESIQELYDAFTLRCAKSLCFAFDPERQPGNPSPLMSEYDRDIYDRFIQWLRDMHDHGQRGYVATVNAVILRDEPCRDKDRFERAVDAHVKIRSAEVRRR